MKTKLEYHKTPHLFIYDNRVLSQSVLDVSVFKRLCESSCIIGFLQNCIVKEISQLFKMRE